jgi:hypothetical protein
MSKHMASSRVCLTLRFPFRHPQRNVLARGRVASVTETALGIERNRLARSSSAFPIVYPEDDEVINLPDEKLRRALIRRWTLAKD